MSRSPEAAPPLRSPREPAEGWSVGIDIVDVSEIEESLARLGERYLRRVYSARENRAWGADAAGRCDVRRLAACFAVKEATLKVLDPEGEAVDWRCIEVRLGDDSGTLVELTGGGAELAARRGIGRLAGSVDIRRAQATAIVFAERVGAAGRESGCE